MNLSFMFALIVLVAIVHQQVFAQTPCAQSASCSCCCYTSITPSLLEVSPGFTACFHKNYGILPCCGADQTDEPPLPPTLLKPPDPIFTLATTTGDVGVATETTPEAQLRNGNGDDDGDGGYQQTYDSNGYANEHGGEGGDYGGVDAAHTGGKSGKGGKGGMGGKSGMGGMGKQGKTGKSGEGKGGDAGDEGGYRSNNGQQQYGPDGQYRVGGDVSTSAPSTSLPQQPAEQPGCFNDQCSCCCFYTMEVQLIKITPVLWACSHDTFGVLPCCIPLPDDGDGDGGGDSTTTSSPTPASTLSSPTVAPTPSPTTSLPTPPPTTAAPVQTPTDVQYRQGGGASTGPTSTEQYDHDWNQDQHQQQYGKGGKSGGNNGGGGGGAYGGGNGGGGGGTTGGNSEQGYNRDGKSGGSKQSKHGGKKGDMGKKAPGKLTFSETVSLTTTHDNKTDNTVGVVASGLCILGIVAVVVGVSYRRASHRKRIPRAHSKHQFVEWSKQTIATLDNGRYANSENRAEFVKLFASRSPGKAEACLPGDNNNSNNSPAKTERVVNERTNLLI